MSGGITPLDFLLRLGFREQPCPLGRDGKACLEVGEAFDFDAFIVAFGQAYQAIERADKTLQLCGFYLERRDFPAKRLGDSTNDGHTGSNASQLKHTQDEHFQFKLTYLQINGRNGWTIHFRARSALTTELAAVMNVLTLKQFPECIEFDFAPCFWRRIMHEPSDDRFFDRTTELVHQWFDALSTNFSEAVQLVITADTLLRPFGMGLLGRIPRAIAERERPRAVTPSRSDSAKVVDVESLPQVSEIPTKFDFAISYAGPQRSIAESLANCLNARGYSVFYDKFFGHQLWGKNLTETFDKIFRKSARYCVMIISEEYKARIWTTAERRSAIARALESHGTEYILPIMVEHVDLDGISPNLGYVEMTRTPSMRYAKC